MPRHEPPCPHGTCDGSGFIIDEATNTAYDCACRDEKIRDRRFLVRTLGHVPPRYENASLERNPFLLLPPAMQAPGPPVVMGLGPRQLAA